MEELSLQYAYEKHKHNYNSFKEFKTHIDQLSQTQIGRLIIQPIIDDIQTFRLTHHMTEDGTVVKNEPITF